MKSTFDELVSDMHKFGLKDVMHYGNGSEGQRSAASSFEDNGDILVKSELGEFKITRESDIEKVKSENPEKRAIYTIYNDKKRVATFYLYTESNY